MSLDTRTASDIGASLRGAVKAIITYRSTTDVMQDALREHGYGDEYLATPEGRAAAVDDARNRGLRDLATALVWYGWGLTIMDEALWGPYEAPPPEMVTMYHDCYDRARELLGHGPGMR